MRKHSLWILAGVLFLAWLFRKPLQQRLDQRQTGLTAAADAVVHNSYTTYNTQLYSEPFWRPLLKFFKANAYVPAGDGTIGGGEPANYSVQG